MMMLAGSRVSESGLLGLQVTKYLLPAGDFVTKTGAESELITSTSKIYDSILFYEEFLQFQNKNFYDLCTECMIFYYILDNLPSLTFKTFIQYDI